jgi:hypothetical protein
MGFLLLPIREEEQVLTKRAVKEEEVRTFAEEEEANLVEFYKEYDLIERRLTEN